MMNVMPEKKAHRFSAAAAVVYHRTATSPVSPAEHTSHSSWVVGWRGLGTGMVVWQRNQKVPWEVEWQAGVGGEGMRESNPVGEGNR